jgi:hypothetical protein
MLKANMESLKTSHGFGTIYVLLIFVTIGVVGFAGWYVWSVNNETDAAPAGVNEIVAKMPVDNQVDKMNSFEAVDLVKLTYSTAMDYVKQTTNADQGQIDTVKAYLGTEKYSQMSSDYSNNRTHYDPFTCAQDYVPSYTISLADTQNGIATIRVEENFVSPVTVLYRVDLSLRRIISIDCL